MIRLHLSVALMFCADFYPFCPSASCKCKPYYKIEYCTRDRTSLRSVISSSSPAAIIVQRLLHICTQKPTDMADEHAKAMAMQSGAIKKFQKKCVQDQG